MVGCVLLPVLLLAGWFGWTVVRVSRAAVLTQASMQLARYPCVGESDYILPHSRKSNRVAQAAYYSNGDENYIQAIWLIPLTEAALKARFSKQKINQLYAALARYGGDQTGYDAASQQLYTKPFCSLSSHQRQVVDFVSYPLRDLLGNDEQLIRETDWAKETLYRAKHP